MEEKNITYNVALLSLMKGFDGRSLKIVDALYQDDVCYVKQSVLRNWLRKIHNININVKHRTHSQTYCFNITGAYQIGDNGELYSELYTKFDSYEDALEKALKEGLNLIKL